MTESSAASQYFEHLPAYSLAICRECRYGVLPSHARRHLQSVYQGIQGRQAQSIADELESWPGLKQYASELEVPSQSIKPISQLPIYTDGLMCALAPSRCRQIVQSFRVIKNH
ncbi:hypothetical protein PMIN03_011921 [Paraphaeosphaeria minitans]